MIYHVNGQAPPERAPLTWRDLPGRYINNPLGSEFPAWRLHVKAVAPFGVDDGIVITAEEGVLVCAADMLWDQLIVTPEELALEAEVLDDELARIAAREAGRG